MRAANIFHANSVIFETKFGPPPKNVLHSHKIKVLLQWIVNNKMKMMEKKLISYKHEPI